MAIVSLTDTQSCTDFFQRRILVDLQYWRDYVLVKGLDVPALDRERDGIIRAITFALDLDEAWSTVCELITTLSSYMERRGYWETWQWVLNRAVEVAHRVGDTSNSVELSLLLARLLQRQGQFKSAIARYRQTIHLARQIGDLYNEARACTNLGYFYIEQGHWHRAEVLCCYALKLFEQIDNNHGRAHTENHLGILCNRQHRWAQARQHFERACAIWQTTGDEHGLMYGLINLGGFYIRIKQPDEALRYLERALHLAKSTGDEAIIGRIYANMGFANTLGRELVKAEAYAWQAEAIFRRLSDLAELARVWNILGVTYCHQGKWQEAILHLKNSLEAWRKLDNEIGEIEVLMDMVEFELTRQNRRQALARLKEVENIMGQDRTDSRYRHFQPRLTKYWLELEDFNREK